MSNASDRSGLHSDPSRGPAAASRKSRPAPPQPIQSRIPRPPQPVLNVQANAQDGLKVADAAVETKTLWDTIIRRKKLVGAVAFAVVTVAGTLLGARIKETWQEYGRRKELEEAAQKLNEGIPATTLTDSSTTIDTKAEQEKSKQQIVSPQASTAPMTGQGKSTYSVDVARQIALLEDRKALLNRQRINFEQKIQMLKERKARKEQIKSL